MSASGREACSASRSVVVEVATAVKIATPRAPPSHIDELINAAARPALSGDTPSWAAVVVPTSTAPRPSDVSVSAGRTLDQYEPSTGIFESQKMPPAPRVAPATITGRVPTLPIRFVAIPAEITTPKHGARYAAPDSNWLSPSTFCM